MADGIYSKGKASDFLKATEEMSQQVLEAEVGEPTYWAGIDFLSLASRTMAANPGEKYLPEEPTAIFRVWAALTDEWDAPGRGSPELRAAAVQHMKRAATEWLAVLDSSEERSAYLDRWLYEECGYKR